MPKTDPIVLLRPYMGAEPQKTPLTILVSKKVFKTAVSRNKARRRIKEAYRLVIQEMNKKEITPLRIHANISVLSADFEELKKIIKKAI